MSTPASVILLPETTDATICVEFRGTVGVDDYMRNVYDTCADSVKKRGYYNILIHYHPDFIGWEPEAASINFRQISEMGPKVRRAAYVNPPGKKIIQRHMQLPPVAGDIRMFAENELDQALAWVASA